MTDATPDRSLTLQGAYNLRDLGGIPLQRGRQVKSRAFFRMDDPCTLTPADVAFIQALGVHTVIDLRSAEEVNVRPHPLADVPWAAYANISLSVQPTDVASIMMLADMRKLYAYMLSNCGAVWVNVFRFVLAHEGAVLFHCTAGKDRTGVMAMLLLSLAGADDQEIIDDYALTESAIAPRKEHLLKICPPGIDPQRYENALHAYPDTMRATLEVLHAQYTDAWGYLALQGMTTEELVALHSRLV